MPVHTNADISLDPVLKIEEAETLVVSYLRSLVFLLK